MTLLSFIFNFRNKDITTDFCSVFLVHCSLTTDLRAVKLSACRRSQCLPEKELLTSLVQ